MWCGKAGVIRLVGVWRDEVRQVWRGAFGSGFVRLGTAGGARQGYVRRGLVWISKAGEVSQGNVRCGLVWISKAGMARCGALQYGVVGCGKAGKAGASLRLVRRGGVMQVRPGVVW